MRVALPLSTNPVERPPDRTPAPVAVGKPSHAFFQLALDSLASHGLENSQIGMVRPPRPSLRPPQTSTDSRCLQIGDDAVQDVGPAVAALGFRRFLVQTGKYRAGDEDRLEGDEGGDALSATPAWVGKDFAAAVDAVLAGEP